MIPALTPAVNPKSSAFTISDFINFDASSGNGNNITPNQRSFPTRARTLHRGAGFLPANYCRDPPWSTKSHRSHDSSSRRHLAGVFPRAHSNCRDKIQAIIKDSFAYT
jgi:hypothetical protein